MSYETLTNKQSQYTLLLHKGYSNFDAYIEIYKTDKMKPETISANASRLASNDKVKAYLEELKAKSESKAVSTVQVRLERLTVFENEDIQRDGVPIRTSNIQAIDIHNKIDKLYSDNPNNTNVIINIISNIPRPATKETIDVSSKTEAVHSLQEGKDLPAD